MMCDMSNGETDGIVPFGGWDMPVQYPDGIIHEVNQVRNNVGIFDVSHMARREISCW